MLGTSLVLVVPYGVYKIIGMFGLFFLVFKRNRLVYLLIGLEMLLMSAIFMYRRLLSGEGVVLMLLFGVVRSISGILVLVKVIRSYGNDLVIE